MRANRIVSSVFDQHDSPMMLTEIRGLIEAQRQFCVSFDKYGIATLSAPPEQTSQPTPSAA